MNHCPDPLPEALQPVGDFPPRVLLICCQCGQRKTRIEKALRPEKHGPYLPHSQYEIWPGNSPYIDDCKGPPIATQNSPEAHSTGEAKQEAEVRAVRIPKSKRRTGRAGAGDVSGKDTEYLLDLRDRHASPSIPQPRG